jgi:hypothetical protein
MSAPWRPAVSWAISRSILLSILTLGLETMTLAAEHDGQPGEIKLTKQAIYVSVRLSASPSGGVEVMVNPPPLLWPRTAEKDVRYKVRLSQDPAFAADNTIVSSGQPWAVFNPHKKLASGTWYWQYVVAGKGEAAWSSSNVFLVTDTTRVFETRTAAEMLAACPRTHPRLLVKADHLEAFRMRVRDMDAAATLVELARKRLGQIPPRELDAVPKRNSEYEHQTRKLLSDASKELGQRVWNVVSVFCQAYLINGDERFGREAVRWAVCVALWDRSGISGQNDLGDVYCLEAMTLAYDSCYRLLAEADKRQLLKGIKGRAGYYFSRWINHLENLLHREHHWGHILPPAVKSAMVTLGDLPEAETWLSYGYEVWLALTPSAGCDDGGWMLGTNYNGVGSDCLIGMPAFFQNLTGDDLFAAPFYRNNLYYLIYCQPPQSHSDGFGDAHERERGPRSFHLRYVEALGRRLGDPNAVWYVEKSKQQGAKRESKKKALDWSELGWGKEYKLPLWTGPLDLPQARAFRQAGVVAMHTDLADPPHDLFVGFRSSPWGSYSHAQADQNTFNIVVGGERLFYSSGYKMPIGDPHSLGWYKHTRGHNGILIDGNGQPYGSEAYGWIPRYLHGQRITYCVGDASRAYDTKPVADDEETLLSSTEATKYRSAQAGLTRFRRHVMLLRPSTVVVYDELVADHDAEWSWLLHSMEPVQLMANRHCLFASAGEARSRVDLFGSVPLRFELTSHFAVPAVNWRDKFNRDGEKLNYADNQWHFTAVSGSKTPAMRFLAIIQIHQAGDAGGFAEMKADQEGWMAADQWRIRAQLDAAQTAYLEIRLADGSAGLVTGKSHLTLDGKSYNSKRLGSALLVEKTADDLIVQEAVDELPEAAR